MLARCYKPATRGYARYGGRGIAVCDRWHSFENFLADMGERPPGMSIDRIDSDGNYEPGNCRWATRQEQEANKKREDGIPVKRKAVRRLRIREMWELGASAAEIAAVINTSATAVSQEVSRMRRDGIALPSRQVDREARREALRRKALNLRQAGQTNREIAECLGMSPVGVAGLLNELRSAGTEVPRAPRRAWTESWSGRRDR
jgi:predicted transcriptional regulator